MIRSVLFDTETTGLDPLNGDRLIEVAALELINDLPTGRHFHALIDPQRDIPPEATRVHGMTSADLAGKPLFAAIAQPLLEFLQDDKLIAHNALFDFARPGGRRVRHQRHDPNERAEPLGPTPARAGASIRRLARAR